MGSQRLTRFTLLHPYEKITSSKGNYMLKGKKAYSYIRMSSELQLKGDSLKRQTKLSEAYAAQNGLILVNDSFHDLGVSAFKSGNMKTGNLGRFLELVRDGVIEADSVLLVESLDRISRDEVTTALSLFQEIVNLGITIVTLTDNQIYSKATIAADPMKLMIGILYMMRAHEESKTKSMRIAAAWQSKREGVSTKKLTAMCPHWLKLADDSRSFIVLEDRAEILRQIFQWSVDGHGTGLITKMLNTQGVPHWGDSDGWHSSYIKKIIVNRGVMGELTTYKRIEGKRVPQQVIEDYYPRVVSPELFYQAQKAQESRVHKGGRKGHQVANLFTGLVRCGYCGGAAHKKSRGPKNKAYLTCDRAQRGLGCIGNGFQYEALEQTFLRLLTEIDINELIIGVNAKDELKKVSALIKDKQVKQQHIQAQLDKLLAILEDGDIAAPKLLLKRMNEFEEQLAATKLELVDLESQKKTIEIQPTRSRLAVEEARDLIATLSTLEGEQITEVRTKIQQSIRSLVDTVKIYPKGETPNAGKEETELRELMLKGKMSQARADEIISKLHRSVKPTYTVIFKSNRICKVEPDMNKPSEWHSILDSDDLGWKELFS